MKNAEAKIMEMEKGHVLSDEDKKLGTLSPKNNSNGFKDFFKSFATD